MVRQEWLTTSRLLWFCPFATLAKFSWNPFLSMWTSHISWVELET